MAIVIVGTHPTAEWTKSHCVAKERYRTIMDNLQTIGRRNMLSAADTCMSG